jgi:hypothetical protein
MKRLPNVRSVKLGQLVGMEGCLCIASSSPLFSQIDYCGNRSARATGALIRTVHSVAIVSHLA